MSRWRRIRPDGIIQHVVNRGAKRSLLFRQPVDCEDFLELLVDASERYPVSLAGFTLMKNHFHLLLWPKEGCAISDYMQWLMNAHIRQYRQRYGGRGEGHIYQGRYRSSLVETVPDLLRAMRYVEANALRAGFVERAEEWPWCSLGRAETMSGRPLLDPAMSYRSEEWLELVNTPMDHLELEAIRTSIRSGAPFAPPPCDGEKEDAARGALERGRGRPRKWPKLPGVT
jgi:putative transposase